MKRLNKTLRRRRQRRQRSRGGRHRLFLRKRQTRKQRGGDLPVPAGSLVGVSFEGEYGAPIMMRKEQYEAEKERGGLED